jgi:hypothetical protein
MRADLLILGIASLAAIVAIALAVGGHFAEWLDRPPRLRLGERPPPRTDLIPPPPPGARFEPPPVGGLPAAERLEPPRDPQDPWRAWPAPAPGGARIEVVANLRHDDEVVELRLGERSDVGGYGWTVTTVLADDPAPEAVVIQHLAELVQIMFRDLRDIADRHRIAEEARRGD